MSDVINRKSPQSATMLPVSARQVYTVSQLTRQIKKALETAISYVWVEGEISNFKIYHSGHTYFVLKDADAQLRVVLFAGTRGRLGSAVTLADGQRVRIYGEVTVREESGQLQLIARNVEVAGVGDLMRRFEELKRQLEAEGLFKQERKKALPKLPQRIGIITSPMGAVIHDMLNVLGRRFPNLQIRLLPVRVQGAGAAEEIAAALSFFNRVYGVDSAWPTDLLIVGRGGGSLEDLWAFNEECVARAVAASTIPVISAVGHETDYSLCDFAADVRAPTPSAAAELAVMPKIELAAEVARHAFALRRALSHQITVLRGRLSAVQASGVLRQPELAVEKWAQQLDTLELRLNNLASRQAQEARQRVSQAWGRLALMRERKYRGLEARTGLARQRLEQSARLIYERAATQVLSQQQQLALLNPLAILERGYSVTRGCDGVAIRSVKEVTAEALLTTQFKDGFVRSVVSKG